MSDNTQLDKLFSTSTATDQPDDSFSFEAFGIARVDGDAFEKNVQEAIVKALYAQSDGNGKASGSWASLYKDVVQPLAKNDREALYAAMIFGQMRYKIMMRAHEDMSTDSEAKLKQLLKILTLMKGKNPPGM